MSDDLFTAQEAADFLKVKKTTVYELVKRGDLPSTKIGKQLRIPRAALEGMTGAAHSQPSSPPCGRGAGPGSSCAGRTAPWTSLPTRSPPARATERWSSALTRAVTTV